MAAYLAGALFLDSRGELEVFEGAALPFEVKRVFMLRSVPKGETRGGHSHRLTRLLLICASGSCNVRIVTEKADSSFPLEAKGKALLVEPGEWHELAGFSDDAVVVVLASETYDSEDYSACPPQR